MTVKQPKPIPSFRRHKASGQGLVELNGQRIYLGRFDLPETQQRYHRLIAEWLANGRRSPGEDDPDQADYLVVELAAAFLRFAKAYYVMGGEPTGEVAIPRFTPTRFSLTGDGLCCGYDLGLPICDDYRPPFRFTGRLLRVVVDVEGEPFVDPGAEAEIAIRSQ